MDQFNKQTFERELGWEDEILNDGQEFIDIPDGEYDFLVETIDRGRYNGGPNMPACNQAKLTLVMDVAGVGQARLTTNLLLHSKLEWKLSEFFASIGLKQKDQPLRMRWNIQGAKGRCKIAHRLGKDGKSYNEVKRFIPVWEVKKQVTNTQSNYNSGNQSTYGGYKQGQF